MLNFIHSTNIWTFKLRKCTVFEDGLKDGSTFDRRVGVMQRKLYELSQESVGYVHIMMDHLFCFKHMAQGR